MMKMKEIWEDAKWELPEDFMQKTHYLRVLKKIDWTSSPGYPYMRRAPTNGDLFRCKEGIPDPAKVDEMWEMVQSQIRERVSDPIRLFVKAEPHKIKKIEQGRYRLISSVSVIDQIIDHMLFSEMNEKLIENWMTVPSKIGWSPVWGGWRAIPKETWRASDKSSWDWTVHLWLVEMVLELRAALCQTQGKLFEQWFELALWRYKELYVSPLFVTSGGIVLRQVNPGIMKSGCVNTISDNSVMQSLIHVRVCLEMGIPPRKMYCMGDDTLEEDGPNASEYLEKLGQYSILKESALVNEFAGFRFMGKRIEPLYKGKHAFTLLHVDPSVLPELTSSYLLLYHRSVYRDIMEDLFCQMGQKLTPRSVRDLIYDGF